jgi:hypothetical protein
MNKVNSSRIESSAMNGSGPARRARIRSLRPTRSSVSAEIAFTPDVIELDPAPEASVPVGLETLPNPAPAAPGPIVEEHQTAAPPAPSKPSARSKTPARSAPPPPKGDELTQWCSIVFERGAHGGEFHALQARAGGRREVIATSRSFALPLSYRISWCRRLPNHGRARHAHDALVKQLVGLGWREMPTRGRWHDSAFVRSAPARASEPPQRGG